MVILATYLSSLSLLMSSQFFLQLKMTSMKLPAKLFAESLSPVWAITGSAGNEVGWALVDRGKDLRTRTFFVTG